MSLQHTSCSNLNKEDYCKEDNICNSEACCSQVECKTNISDDQNNKTANSEAGPKPCCGINKEGATDTTYRPHLEIQNSSHFINDVDVLEKSQPESNFSSNDCNKIDFPSNDIDGLQGKFVARQLLLKAHDSLVQRLVIIYLKLMLLLITRPLLRDGGMAEDHGAPEAGQLPRVWTSGHRDRESPKSERCKESVAGQCRMR